MAQEQYQFIITARDQSRAVVQGVIGQMRSAGAMAARAMTAPFRALTSLRAVGLQSSIQMLQAAARGMDNLIERGARMEVVERAFGSQLGVAASEARRYAREIQGASQGTMTQARAMEVANRALAGGLNLEQIKTAVEFVAKKAVTTGKSAAQAIETVMTGLVRGTTLFLDDFGILVDGVDEVRRNYDKIRGAGAFDDLAPAAQKAETVRAAIEQMTEQMAKMGVSGNETYFWWQRIKSLGGDTVDRIARAVTQSKFFADSIKAASKWLSDISASFEKGEFWEGLKKMGAGLWTAIKAPFLDLAENMGALISYGLLKSIQAMAPRLADMLGLPPDLALKLPGMARTAQAMAGAGGAAPAAPAVPGKGRPLPASELRRQLRQAEVYLAHPERDPEVQRRTRELMNQELARRRVAKEAMPRTRSEELALRRQMQDQAEAEGREELEQKKGRLRAELGGRTGSDAAVRVQRKALEAQVNRMQRAISGDEIDEEIAWTEEQRERARRRKRGHKKWLKKAQEELAEFEAGGAGGGAAATGNQAAGALQQGATSTAHAASLLEKAAQMLVGVLGVVNVIAGNTAAMEAAAPTLGRRSGRK